MVIGVTQETRTGGCERELLGCAGASGIREGLSEK